MVTARLASILPVWVIVVIGIVLVAILVEPTGYYRWLSILLALAILVSFALQLALSQKDGLVLRLTISVGGSVILLAGATAVLLLTNA
jgi:hypothetical protein